MYDLKFIERAVGPRLYEGQLFEDFKEHLYDNLKLSKYGKVYDTWRLTKKGPFSHELEPRIKKYLFEEYERRTKQSLYLSHGPYFFDRLDEEELKFHKQQGLIHQNFVYDHPYWFSRDPLPFFLQSLQRSEKREYVKWNLRGKDSWTVGINNFDIEPRFWDGECNRRLTQNELLLAKEDNFIHNDFVYDKMFWRKKKASNLWSYIYKKQQR